LNPVWNQAVLRDINARDDIVTESWSPLGRGLPLESLRAIADASSVHGKTPSQVVLRWQLQLGALPIPKAASIEHQRENLDVFGFALSNEEMAALSMIDQLRPDSNPETHEEF
jgi:2,5-diketo-D-gluconate reductase A